MFCTKQYSFHCPSTLSVPRKVKRSIFLLPRTLPNTGSTVAKRRVIISRPRSESILRFMRSLACSLALACLPTKMATCLMMVRCGWRRHWALNGHFSQSRLAPVNLIALRPPMLQFAPLRYSRFPAGQMAVAEILGHLEITWAKQTRFVLCLLALVPQRIGLGAVLLLAFVARVALAIAVVGNVALDPARFQLLDIVLAVVAAVCRNAGVGCTKLFYLIEHRRQHLLLRAAAQRLCMH